MSSYGTPQHAFSPNPPQPYYASTPPAPPPKRAGSDTASHGPPLPPPPPELSELDGSATQPHLNSQLSHQSHIPPIEPGWLPQSIQDKTVPDLHALLQDPALQAAFLGNPNTTHAAIPASEAALTPIIQANLQLSQSLLQLESSLKNLRESSQQRLLSLRALEQQHRSKLNETETALQSFSPMALYQRLSASVQEQNNLVRGLEESWLDSDEGVASASEINEVVRRVREAKRVSFLRQERRSRWDEGRVGGWR